MRVFLINIKFACIYLLLVDTSVPQKYDTIILPVLWGCEP
jgi:hypothetical protein